MPRTEQEVNCMLFWVATAAAAADICVRWCTGRDSGGEQGEGMQSMVHGVDAGVDLVVVNGS